MPWSAIAGLAGSIINNIQQNRRAEEDRNYQSQLSEWEWQRNQEATQSQREWDLAMWNRQNEYNDPASQIERYKAAGINPNLIMGQGGITAGNASSAPSSSAPRYNARESKLSKNFLDFSSIFNMYKELTNFDLDSKQKEVEIDKRLAEINELNEKVITEKKQQQWLENQSTNILARLGFDERVFESDKARREWEQGYWNARKGLAYLEGSWDRDIKKYQHLQTKQAYDYNKAKMQFDKDIMSMSLPYYRSFYSSKKQLFDKFGTDGVDYRYTDIGSVPKSQRIGMPLLSQLGDVAIQSLGNLLDSFVNYKFNKKGATPLKTYEYGYNGENAYERHFEYMY